MCCGVMLLLLIIYTIYIYDIILYINIYIYIYMTYISIRLILIAYVVMRLCATFAMFFQATSLALYTLDLFNSNKTFQLILQTLYLCSNHALPV